VSGLPTNGSWIAKAPPIVPSEHDTTMRALSIRQPWADFILHMSKNVENRPWNTHYRGPFWIHVPQTLDLVALTDRRLGRALLQLHGLERIRDYKPRLGVLLGAVVMTDVVTESDSPWFDGPYGFVLEARRPLERPVPMAGGQRWWYPWRRYNFDDDIEEVRPVDDQTMAFMLGAELPQERRR